MATPRRLLVDPAKSGVFHCVSRCVRRAFLCGCDPYSGQDYQHRRAWIRDRLRELAGLFAVEVHSYAVMSNHLHLVVRTLPGLVGGWSDEETARRWLAVAVPRQRRPTGFPARWGISSKELSPRGRSPRGRWVAGRHCRRRRQ